MSDANKLADLLPLEAAARKIGMNRDRLKKLCIDAGIAVRWGGSDSHPWLRVRLSDAQRVILNRRVVTHPRKARKVFRRGVANPDVTC